MLTTSSSTRRLWFNRDFVLLWSGQLVSATGSQVSLVAFPLLILGLTGSPAQTGLISALGAFVYLVFSLPAGALVDRWDRKKVMVACDACRCVNMASVPAVAIGWHVTVIQLATVSMVEGTMAVFFSAAESAAVARIVPRERLPAAAACTLAGDRVAVLLGPPLGGFLYGSVGRLVPFLADAVSYGASVVSLLFVQAELQERRDEGAPGRPLGHQIVEGVAWLWRRPLLRFLVISGAGINLIFGGSTLVVIVLARHLHASAAVIGAVLAAGGVGGILGSFVVHAVQRRFGVGEISIAVHWLWLLLWLVYAVAPNPVVLAGLEGAMLALSTVRTATVYSYRLSMIPDELQGRVNSITRLISFGGQPVSLAITGVLLQSIGLYPTILAIAGSLAILAVIVTSYRELRRAPRLAELSSEITPPV